LISNKAIDVGREEVKDMWKMHVIVVEKDDPIIVGEGLFLG
jgi:hypothetical protein